MFNTQCEHEGKLDRFSTEVKSKVLYSLIAVVLFCRCWSIKTEQCVMVMLGHSSTVNCLDVHADRLVSGAKDCKVKGNHPPQNPLQDVSMSAD